jgi:hypothetical protein
LGRVFQEKQPALNAGKCGNLAAFHRAISLKIVPVTTALLVLVCLNCGAKKL